MSSGGDGRGLSFESRALRAAITVPGVAAVILYWLRGLVPQPWLTIKIAAGNLRAQILNRPYFTVNGHVITTGDFVYTNLLHYLNHFWFADCVISLSLAAGVAVAVALDKLFLALGTRQNTISRTR